MIVNSNANFAIYPSDLRPFTLLEEMEVCYTLTKSSRLHLQDMGVIMGEELGLFVC